MPSAWPCAGAELFLPDLIAAAVYQRERTDCQNDSTTSLPACSGASVLSYKMGLSRPSTVHSYNCIKFENISHNRKLLCNFLNILL